MGDNGILALAPVFSKCKLEILELQVKFFGNIVMYLLKCDTKRNHIGPAGIATILESTNNSLTKLDLGVECQSESIPNENPAI